MLYSVYVYKKLHSDIYLHIFQIHTWRAILNWSFRLLLPQTKTWSLRGFSGLFSVAQKHQFVDNLHFNYELRILLLTKDYSIFSGCNIISIFYTQLYFTHSYIEKKCIHCVSPIRPYILFAKDFIDPYLGYYKEILIMSDYGLCSLFLDSSLCH